MQQIRVLLVDDSPLYLGMLQAAVRLNKTMCLVGCYNDGQKALKDVLKLQPDVVVCDWHMPQISGVEFTESLRKKFLVPVVAVSRDKMAAKEALSVGASCFITKQQGGADGNMHFSTQVIQAIETITQRETETKPVQAVHVDKTLPDPFNKKTCGVVAIGASTGGTEATLEVVRNFPADFPAVLITQHMPVGFTSLYAERLQRECFMQVREAVNGLRVQQGQAIVAAGERHMCLKRDDKGFYVTSRPGEKVCGHVPSVDVLFDSVAKEAEENAVGVLLTGMGSDGATGLLAMRAAGAYTYGQDESSSVVYGMPKVAYDMGAVMKQLPLQKMGADLIQKAFEHLK